MILIVGGTGSLGSATARRLLATGVPVRVLTRTPQQATELEKSGAEIVRGDLRDKRSLVQACRGVDRVMASAHSILGRGLEASKYVDLQGHRDLIDVARAAGVGHFVYVSAYNFGPEFETVPFFRIKREVERHLQASGLPFTILRPTAFMEAHAELFIGKPIMEEGKVTLFGKGEKRRNFIAADDVAQIAVLALEDNNLGGQTIDIGGPEDLTNMEVVRLYEKLAGRPAKVSHMPLPVMKVMYRLLRPFHPGLSQIMQFSIYADTIDTAFDPAPMLSRFPMKLTRLEDFVQQRAGQWPTTSATARADRLAQV